MKLTSFNPFIIFTDYRRRKGCSWRLQKGLECIIVDASSLLVTIEYFCAIRLGQSIVKQERNIIFFCGLKKSFYLCSCKTKRRFGLFILNNK